MRLAIVSPGPPYRGGISDLSALVAGELRKRHDLLFVNYRRQYPRILFPGKTEYKVGPPTDFENERILDSLNPLTWLQTVQRLQAYGPEMVLFRYWHPFFAPLIMTIARRLRRHGIPSALLVDNLLPHESTPVDRILARHLLKSVSAAFTLSRSVANEIEIVSGRQPTGILFHPLYSQFEMFPDRDHARQKLGLDERPVLMFFGLIRPYKGLDVFIKAMRLLRERMIPFQGLIVGECYEDAARYHALIRDEGVDDDVRFMDRFVPDAEVPIYFAAADTLVLPYRTASQSGIVGIALQLERPVVATRVGGLDEYIEDGRSGQLVAPDDPRALADALANLLVSGSLDDMQKTIHQTKERFSIKAFCQRLEEALEHA